VDLPDPLNPVSTIILLRGRWTCGDIEIVLMGAADDDVAGGGVVSGSVVSDQ